MACASATLNPLVAAREIVVASVSDVADHRTAPRVGTFHPIHHGGLSTGPVNASQRLNGERSGGGCARHYVPGGGRKSYPQGIGNLARATALRGQAPVRPGMGSPNRPRASLVQDA
jgi:hypothetical protein